MNIELVAVDQDWDSETTEYTFDIDGSKSVVSDTNGNMSNKSGISKEAFAVLIAFIAEMNA